MNSLVVGALGFIGSHLVESLRAARHYVWGVDNGSQATSFETKAHGLSLVDASQNFASWLPKERKWDYVWHCASPAGPARIAPGYALEPIIQLTRVGLDFAHHHRAKFIKFSTSEVYGRSDILLTEERAPVVKVPFDARSEYQLGFLAAEQLCFTHPCEQVQVLRLFNVTGPRQDWQAGVVLPRFCYAAAHGFPLSVFGDGNQRRVFMDVDDLTRFCHALIDRWPERKEVWNVANPYNYASVLQLATEVRNLAGTSSEIVFTSGRQTLGENYRDGVEKRNVSIAKATTRLGWHPEVDLATIIKRTLAYHKENHDRENDARIATDVVLADTHVGTGYIAAGYHDAGTDTSRPDEADSVGSGGATVARH